MAGPDDTGTPNDRRRWVGRSDGRIRISPKPPGELIEMVSFFRQMDEAMRGLREETSLPRAAVTLPGEFDDVVSEVFGSIEEQARAAQAAGLSSCEIALRRSPAFDRLARWGGDRLDLLEGLARAGMVGAAWERPLKVMIGFWHETLAQIEDL